jgi:hypothetical protein
MRLGRREIIQMAERYTGLVESRFFEVLQSTVTLTNYKLQLCLTSYGRRDLYRIAGTCFNALPAADAVTGLSNILDIRDLRWADIQAFFAPGALAHVKLDPKNTDPVEQTENAAKRAQEAAPESPDQDERYQG